MTKRVHEVELLRIAGIARVEVTVGEGEEHEEIVRRAVARATEPEVVAAFDRDLERRGYAVKEGEIRFVRRLASGPEVA